MTAKMKREKRRMLRKLRRRLGRRNARGIQVVSALSDRIEEYIEETGATSFSAVIAQFGTVEEIALSVEMETHESVAQLSKKARVIRMIVAAVLMVLISWLGYWMISVFSELKYNHALYAGASVLISCEKELVFFGFRL